MSIPNCQHVVADLAARFPDEWRKAHNPSGGGPETEAFIRRLAWVLHSTVDARFGLNGKRGNPNDLSDDAINWIGDGPGHDPLTGRPVTVIDVIGGAGGPNPTPQWTVFSDLPGPGAWVKPEPVGEVVAPPVVSNIWTAAHEAVRVQMFGRSAREIAEQLAHSFPSEAWGEKRTRTGAPSPDTIGRLVDGRLYGVRVMNGVKEWGFLEDQIHLPVAPVNHLGVSVPPVVVPPVNPPPVVVPPAVPSDLAARLAAIEQAIAGLATKNDIASLGTLVSSLRQEVLDTVRGQSYDIDASAGYFGRVRGTIKPKP